MSNYFKLQNGSDVRGVALEGVEGESVNLTYKETYYLAISFANWLAGKLNRPVETLKIAVGCDSSLALNPSKKAFSAVWPRQEQHLSTAASLQPRQPS